MEANRLYYAHVAGSGLDESERAEFIDLYERVSVNEELQGALGIRLLPTVTPLTEILAARRSDAYMSYEPTDTYLQTDAPVSLFVGEHDENISPELTIAAMEDVIARRPSADITLVVVPDATHPLFVLSSPVEGISQDLLIANVAGYEFAPGYIQDLRTWIREKAGL